MCVCVYVYVHVCVDDCVYACACVYTINVQAPTDPGVRITGGCELPNVGTGTRTLVLWNNT